MLAAGRRYNRITLELGLVLLSSLGLMLYVKKEANIRGDEVESGSNLGRPGTESNLEK